MRALIPFALLILATPALAQIQAQPRSVSPSAATVTLTATQDIQVTLVWATLIDGQGRSYDLTGLARGITTGTRSSCKVNSSLPAGVPQIVSIPFSAQGSTRPYGLTMEFEIPDRSQMFGCRTFTVSLERLQ